MRARVVMGWVEAPPEPEPEEEGEFAAEGEPGADVFAEAEMAGEARDA